MASLFTGASLDADGLSCSPAERYSRDSVRHTARQQRPHRLQALIFHALCTEPAEFSWTQDDYAAALARDERFFSRLPDLRLEGKSVLDYGCGAGTTCVALARRGAARVLGVDIQDVTDAQRWISAAHPEQAPRIELRRIVGPAKLAGERFDVVLSKNTFEHVADPERYVADMVSALADDGLLVIGFGPFWKSPYGGHLNFMTRVPWAHLIFDEQVILAERRRYRPDENPARLEEVKGGLNRMTPARFDAIMSASGLEPIYYEINRNDRPSARLLNAFRRVPGLGEYFTFSVHSVWRRPRAPM